MRSGGAEFRCECSCVAPRKNRLGAARCGGKIGCVCGSGDEHIVQLIEGNPLAAGAGPAQIRGEDKMLMSSALSLEMNAFSQLTSTFLQLGWKTPAVVGKSVELTVPTI